MKTAEIGKEIVQTLGSSRLRNSSTGDRLLNLVAMLLAGDGLCTLVHPRHETRLWAKGPEPYKQAMNKLSRRPGLTRCLALLELGIGLCLAARHRRARRPVD